MEKTERMLALVKQWRSSGMSQKEFCQEAAQVYDFLICFDRRSSMVKDGQTSKIIQYINEIYSAEITII